MSFKTVTFGGSYAPKHVGVVWIEDAGGGYIRSIDGWAKTRKKHLVNWNAASSGDQNAGDALTRATIKSHETHSLKWDLTDASGKKVSAGDYLLRAEFTERNGEGRQMSIPFTLGAGEQTVSPSDEANFTSISIHVPG